MIDLSAKDSPRSQRVREFYLGRQPILDRQQGLFGYELLFRNGPVGPAQFDSTALSATAAVLAHVAQLGVDKAIDDGPGFVNVDEGALLSDIFGFLPRERIVLEIAGSVPASPAVLARLTDLAGHGFRFALDGLHEDAAQLQALLPMAEYVKLGLDRGPASGTAAPAGLVALAARLKGDGKKLVAQKVETLDQFRTGLDLGFDFFQGYYFARPVIMSGKKLSPSQLALMELMTLVISDAENSEIERAIKRDAALALNLVRLVNTPAVGARQRIDSLGQALTILGRRQLQRWLQIMLYAEPGKRGTSQTPLLALATTRGRLLELLAQKLRPAHRHVADIAFTVGIMSLMDTLFSMPMAELLGQIAVSEEVADALLYRGGFFGELLKLAECIERVEEDELVPALHDLAVSTVELVELEMAAFEWSDNVVRYAI
ncbi:EAL and modified HD-GYP domain-containing signal transduction protein [Pseudoduganella lurida]|uniref:EAL and modified HD-GYP domain-containing signal transduction protein n=1 Tax=Pseudoduganella lurida TaxID=1036180 RepID=A0A562R3P9_9BURK|nr:EAL domain-containing protein [Pseudoduganella lurida]TWI63688.1 EAL and modified HD-GYP domain-containing signal transduction protein [Pseudoduganella lurida]